MSAARQLGLAEAVHLDQVTSDILLGGPRAEAAETMVAREGYNLLVVSDLHLGDALVPGKDSLRQFARLNRGLAKFLLHYATATVDGRPWRLVINGDMIDFLHAGLAHGSELALSEDAAVRWLEKVMSHERRVFRALATFIAAGHQVVIVKGNHDVQFHFATVQRRFLTLLSELWARWAPRAGVLPTEAERAAFEGRVSFRDWFYYEKDLVYIEHGNQYDEFCSYEHVLQPIDPDLYELEEPVSHRLYREFARIIHAVMDVHHIDRWRLFDYVRWLAGLGPKVIGQLAYTYFASVAWLVGTKRRLSERAARARVQHLSRREELTVRYGVSAEILEKLDELRRRPAGRSVWAGLRMLYMDRVFLAGLNVLVMVLALFLPITWWDRVLVVTGFGLLTTLANHLLERGRQVEAHPKLKQAASRVADLLRVPFVVFGHSHVPEASQAAASTRYFNTGSWTAGGLTHLCILIAPGSPVAELRRFCLDSHLPKALDAAALE